MTQHDNVETLQALPVAELRRRWAERVGRGKPPKVKILLSRELVRHAQQPLRGGMDAQTRTLLRSAIRQVKGGPAGADSSADPRDGRARQGRRVTPQGPRPRLRPGSRLVRTWHGVTHEVTVLDGGKRFEYRGEVYRSLTRIARIITGAHWSGPRFFSLHRVRAMR